MNNKSLSVVKWLIATTAFLCAGSVIAYVACFYDQPISKSVEEWGQTGDFFGGVLNPVLATASLTAVCYTLVQQFRENTASSKAQAQQSFEHLLFELLRHHRYNLEAIDLVQGSQKTKGRDCFVIFLQWLKDNHKNLGVQIPTIQSLTDAYKKFYDGHGKKSEVGHYFRNLYHIFKHIDESSDLNEERKIRYAKLVRAQLSSVEMALLFYNCLHPAGERFEKYVKKYALLNELEPSDLVIDGINNSLMIQALGSESFKDVDS